MAENTSTSGNGGPQPEEGAQPSLQIVAQYVKDLSFENPGIGTHIQRPQIDMGVDLQARRAANPPDHYEVTLKLRVSAMQDDKPIFLLELAYCGLFLITGVSEEDVQPLLLIEAPRLIFPFARRIIADAVRDGGLPPLLIEPIDFAALYRAKMAEQAKIRTATA
ncbi:MAG: protein-export chaperone SecB [Alphaproteobacteria bacterium]